MTILPVFNRASRKPADFNDRDKPIEGFSPMRPAGQTFKPRNRKI